MITSSFLCAAARREVPHKPGFSGPAPFLLEPRGRTCYTLPASKSDRDAGGTFPDLLNRGIWVKIPGGAATVKRRRHSLPKSENLPGQ